MSRVIFTKPASVPTSSRTASITTLAQNRLLSRRTPPPPPERALAPPHPPALDRAFALVCSDLEGTRRLAALLLLPGIEATEMLADDFRRRVLVDALRTHVPVGDVAVLVEHEDRVVGNALDDHPKAPFAFHQRLLRLAALGNVMVERGLDPFPLLDFGIQKLGGLGETCGPFLRRFPHVIMRTLQTFFGPATGGDILHHTHEVAHRAALMGGGGDAVA